MPEGANRRLNMAKEDFREGKKPIDMDDFPYQSGDKIGGITVLSVIKGNVDDSFGGYEMRQVLDIKGTKKIYGDNFILPYTTHKDADGKNPVADSSKWPPNAIEVEMVGPVGDPFAQRVYFKRDGEKSSQYMTPEDFLEFAKNGKPKPAGEVSGTPPLEDDGWTAGDDEYITENYKTMTDAEMAEFLEVDAESLKRHRLDDLKLSKKPGA